MKVGYGKIGRSMPLSLDRCANLGGDVEMSAVARELALRFPTDEIILIGRNSGERPEDVGLPPNVTNPWTKLSPLLRERFNATKLNHPNLTIEEHFEVGHIMDDLIGDAITGLDQMVLWIGQHGTTNNPLPGIRKSGLTKPHDAFAYYSAHLLRGVNRWRDVDPIQREPVFLNADSRNYLKMRDMAWPLRHPVLTQLTYEHKLRHERGERHGTLSWGTKWFPNTEEIVKNDTPLWESTVRNVYSRLEVNGLVPGTPFGDLVSFNDAWEDRQHFGLFINEARTYVNEQVARAPIMRDWVVPLSPAWIHGTWSEASKIMLGRDIMPAPWQEYYPRLHSVRSTFTTPSSGSGFATAKPWEAFAAGTVCFFHPRYDDQDNILGDAPEGLRDWLRVSTPSDLHNRVNHLDSHVGRVDWEWLIHAQRNHFENAIGELRYMRMIEDRFGLKR